MADLKLIQISITKPSITYYACKIYLISKMANSPITAIATQHYKMQF